MRGLTRLLVMLALTLTALIGFSAVAWAVDGYPPTTTTGVDAATATKEPTVAAQDATTNQNALAFTGSSNTAPFTIGAVALLLVGSTLIVVSRRRRPTRAE
jgi:LPXTG-motif cell wall-anchored protein